MAADTPPQEALFPEPPRPDSPILREPLSWVPGNRGYVVCRACGTWSALIGADEAPNHRHNCPRSPR